MHIITTNTQLIDVRTSITSSISATPAASTTLDVAGSLLKGVAGIHSGDRDCILIADLVYEKI